VNTSHKHVARTIGIVTLAGAALAMGAGTAYAVASHTIKPAVIVLGPDHQRLVITLAPGASKPIKLPAANDPIRIDIAKVSTNSGVQTPSEVFSALINVDLNKAGMGWIGQNSDGTVVPGTTISGTNITNLDCPGVCTIASLNVLSVPGRTVVLTTNAATSRIAERYVINLWY
jgi:hypothetical protein